MIGLLGLIGSIVGHEFLEDSHFDVNHDSFLPYYFDYCVNIAIHLFIQIGKVSETGKAG